MDVDMDHFNCRLLLVVWNDLPKPPLARYDWQVSLSFLNCVPIKNREHINYPPFCLILQTPEQIWMEIHVC